MKNGLCHASDSIFIVIDLQKRLLPALARTDAKNTFVNSEKLAIASRYLEIPVIVTEQAPEKLGKTLSNVAQHCISKSRPVIVKNSFSAVQFSRFRQLLSYSGRSQVVICGAEAHVCVLQTVMDLIALNMQVFVIEDAIASRLPSNKLNAINRMREAGAIITNTESVIFEWLGASSHPKFKKIHEKLIIGKETAEG